MTITIASFPSPSEAGSALQYYQFDETHKILVAIRVLHRNSKQSYCLVVIVFLTNTNGFGNHAVHNPLDYNW